MEKIVKCLLLKNNLVLVSEVIEIDSELGQPDCKLINPCVLDQSTFEITPWLLFTDQVEILIRSDDVLTLVDPNQKIIDNYLSKIN